MNLLTNAIDAIEEKFSLQSPKSECRSLEPPTIKITTEANYPEFVIIRIADNGNGIPDDLQQRIFDPFFTNKPVGKGTGLGLSISYQIITEKHHGQISFSSQQGKGTEFMIIIPLEIPESSN
jgi:signal transduction histidine kinase